MFLVHTGNESRVQFVLECFKKLHTTQTIHIRVPNEEERKFTESALKSSWPYVYPMQLISSSQLPRSEDLPCVVATFYDHFPKPRRRVRSTSFRRTGWRRRNPSLIGRCRRARRKLPPWKAASLNTFTCECAIEYDAVGMTVVRSRGRSGYRVILCSSGYLSVVE